MSLMWNLKQDNSTVRVKMILYPSLLSVRYLEWAWGDVKVLNKILCIPNTFRNITRFYAALRFSTN